MTQQSSAMSITQLCNIDEPDDNVKNNTIIIKNEQAEEETLLPPIQQQQQQQQQQHFIRRIPLVHTALKAYENSSSVVKYGAEMIESYAGPIYDKLGYDRKLKESEIDVDEETIAATSSSFARVSLYDNELNQRTPSKDRKSRPCSRSTSPHRPYTLHRPIPKSNNSSSRWQQIVLHAGSAAGTTAAVISEESMKCLRYCLSWLQYAMQHIEVQMNLLRNFLVSLVGSNSTTVVVKAADDQNSTLAAIKKEIVDTLRKVVEVVSKYAGSGLPEQAKASVRAFILQLPSTWAHVNKSGSTTVEEQQQPLHETSIKLLDFGGESIVMLKSVSIVFSDTIQRAELWIKRLKVVGVNSSPSAPSMDTN
ncbi:unnamed protein product [Mucor hiemalis]